MAHICDLRLCCCSSEAMLSYLADAVRANGGGCAGNGGRGGVLGECALLVRTRRSAALPCRHGEDAAPYRVRGRAVCPHSAVNAQVECSATVARRGRLTLPCGHAERGALGECTLLVMARRGVSLPWRRLSIIVNKNASNEQNADKIVTVLNKFSYYAKGREAAEEAQKAIAERAKVMVDG